MCLAANSFQVVIMKKETLTITTDTPELRNLVIAKFKDCISFATNRKSMPLCCASGRLSFLTSRCSRQSERCTSHALARQSGPTVARCVSGTLDIASRLEYRDAGFRSRTVSRQRHRVAN
jgi:hypothetical protein